MICISVWEIEPLSIIFIADYCCLVVEVQDLSHEKIIKKGKNVWGFKVVVLDCRKSWVHIAHGNSLTERTLAAFKAVHNKPKNAKYLLHVFKKY